MALTAKQELFAKEYIVDLNATQAAIRAGYSENTARAIGAENLTKPDIQEYIQKLMDERSKRTEITAEYVLNGIKNIADDKAAQDKDKLKAYELLGKHIKLFTDKIEHSGEVTLTFEDQLRDLIK